MMRGIVCALAVAVIIVAAFWVVGSRRDVLPAAVAPTLDRPSAQIVSPPSHAADSVAPSRLTSQTNGAPSAPDSPWEIASRSGPIWVVHEPEDAETVLAEVDGAPITRADVKHRVEYLAKLATAQARARHQAINRALRPAESNVLEQLIEERLLLREADRQGVALTAEDAAARADMLRAYNHQPAVFRMDPPSTAEFDKVARSRRVVERATAGARGPVSDSQITQYCRDHGVTLDTIGRDAVQQRIADERTATARQALLAGLQRRATITVREWK